MSMVREHLSVTDAMVVVRWDVVRKVLNVYVDERENLNRALRAIRWPQEEHTCNGVISIDHPVAFVHEVDVIDGNEFGREDRRRHYSPPAFHRGVAGNLTIR